MPEIENFTIIEHISNSIDNPFHLYMMLIAVKFALKLDSMKAIKVKCDG